MIETGRLILRRWREADREPYAAMMADPEVADWLGGVLTRAEADARIDRSEATFEQHGFGRFALERQADGALVGYCGLMPVGEDLPEAPGVEIGWAVAREAWGQGYAPEAARAVLADAFGRLGLAEVVAYTTVGNVRSQAVMRRAGFVRMPDRDFDHPLFAPGHPLCRHLVFAARA
ncbi:MAG: family N-acetyltransferase [Phenylobacterium sp.]|nr:family N-acetyltransferase [Phenylobacterium sp.]